MKIGVAGAGRMGAFHAGVLAAHPDVEAVRIFDVDSARAESLAADIRATTAPSAAELARWADALVIAAATDAHAGLIHLAADAGLPAFCEKPIALDLATTDAVLAHVRASGIPLQIGFQRRFDEGYREARRTVASGDLGRLYIARLATHDPAPPHEAYIASAGGIYRDLHIHDFDAIRWCTAQEVEEVYASGSVCIDEMFARHDDHDTTVATLRLTDGALAILSGTRHDPRGYDVRMELFGSRDSIAVGWDRRTPLRSVEPDATPPAEEQYRDFLDRFDAAYRAEIDAFLRVARGEMASPCTGEDAREALRISLAATRSLREQRPVRLTEIA